MEVSQRDITTLREAFHNEYFIYGIIAILVIFAIWLVTLVLFSLTLQNTLKAVAVGNRRMRPGQVWLLLIPVFSFAWIFVCVQKISESIEAEYRQRNIPAEPRPTYNIGLAWGILRCTGFIPILGAFGSLAGFVCFIVYWLKVNEFKKAMQSFPPTAIDGGEIFGNRYYKA